MESDEDAGNERALLERARAGEEQAATALVRAFDAELRGYLARRMGSKLRRFGSPDDLAQEVHVRALRALGKVDALPSLDDYRGILLQHAGWVLADHGKKLGRMEGASVVAGVGDDGNRAAIELARSVSSTGTVTRVDEGRWVGVLVERLEPLYREVVQLKLAGRSFAEIADELAITEDTARKRFVRALAKLRQLGDGRVRREE